MTMRLFKRKKTGVWYIAFERGKERSLKTKDEREAKRLFRVIRQEYLKGRIVQLDKSERVTLSEFKKEYLEGRPDLSHSTRRMDDLSLRKLAEVVGDNAALRIVDEKTIEQFKRTFLAKGLTATSINVYLRHLKSAFNTAFELGYTEKPLKIKLLKIGKRLPRILSKTETKAILAHSEEVDFELYRMVSFALWTGCRRSEILNLKWQYVSGDIARIVGKGNKERVVPLLPGALEAMGDRKDIGPVFAPWHPDTLSHRFKKSALACGVTDIHFHNLRHSAATKMLESGISIEIIQKILGHAAISTTQIYATVLDEVMKNEMQKLKW